MNDQNLVVDFHPLTGDNQDPIANHKIIRGKIAQALITGNAAVVIGAGGKQQIFPISPQVRSKVAARVHEQVSGTVVMPLADSQRKMTVRTEGGRRRPLRSENCPKRKWTI